MKPFNLEEALAGKPVVTREGKKVTELYLFKTMKNAYRLFACIDGKVVQCTIKGEFYTVSEESPYDLFMYEPIVEGWVNIYQHSVTGVMWTGDVHATYEHAINTKGDYEHYLKTIKIDNKKP